MIIRMPKNTSNSARYRSSSGHYIASVDLAGDKSLDYVILDSAIDIDVRADKLLGNKNRIGYVPKDFFSKEGNPLGVVYIVDNKKLFDYLSE